MKRFVPVLLLVLFLLATSVSADTPSWEDLQVESSMELYHATQFSVEYLTGGYKRIFIGADQTLLTVPQDQPVPRGIPENVTVIRLPLSGIYMVSSASMDYFRALDRLDAVRLSSQKAESWYLPEVRQAMEDGRMVYAGKYSAPDYEMILSAGCDLAVENTMIYHSPEVMEQLQQLGIPVLVDFSGYETDPLGRMEWIRLYGVLTEREDEAEACYMAAIEELSSILNSGNTGLRVVFFYITTNGTVNVRRSGDYVARAIAMAGGEYVAFDGSTDESAMSTQTISMESFYAGAIDADVLIYNSTIDGEIFSLAELLDKSALLADFKAVKDGNVWCLGKNFYQEPLALGDLILDVNAVLTDPSCEELSLHFLHRVTG